MRITETCQNKQTIPPPPATQKAGAFMTELENTTIKDTHTVKETLEKPLHCVKAGGDLLGILSRRNST